MESQRLLGIRNMTELWLSVAAKWGQVTKADWFYVKFEVFLMKIVLYNLVQWEIKILWLDSNDLTKKLGWWKTNENTLSMKDVDGIYHRWLPGPCTSTMCFEMMGLLPKVSSSNGRPKSKKTTEKTWEITTQIDVFWRVKVQFGGLDHGKCFATFRTSHPGWLLHGECHCFNAFLCTNDRFKKLAKCLWHLQWVGFLTKDFLQSLGDSFHRKMGRYHEIRMDMDHHYPMWHYIWGQ